MLKAVFFWMAAVLSPGLDHFYNLEYDQAITEFRRETSARPDDLGAWNRLAQGILYRQMLKVGALESEMVSRNNPFLRRATVAPDPNDQREFENAVTKTISLGSARFQSNPRDARALYATAVAYALRANWNFLVRKAWYDSLRDATTARRLAQRAVDADPNLTDAKLLMGIHDYLVGNLPLQYRMLGFLAGLRGDREGGLKLLQEVIDKGDSNKHDAQVFLAALYRREKQPEKAIPLLEPAIQQFPRNYLLKLELVNMYADAGRLEPALAILDDLEAHRPPALPLEKILYYRANLLFWYRDYTPALTAIQKATAHVERLDLNTEVMSWLRQGQILDVIGRRQEAQNAYRKAAELAPNSDPGREAKTYGRSAYRRP